MAKKTTPEPEAEVTTEESQEPVAQESPPSDHGPAVQGVVHEITQPVDVYNPVSDIVRRESGPEPVQIKLTKANHFYFRRTIGILRAMGKYR